MTLLQLDGTLTTADDLIPKICFDKNKSWSECETDYKENLDTVFISGSDLSFLIPVFKRALNYNPADRPKTMEELSSAFVEVLMKLKGGIQNANESAEDFSKCQILSMDFSPSMIKNLFVQNDIDYERLNKVCALRQRIQLQI